MTAGLQQLVAPYNLVTARCYLFPVTTLNDMGAVLSLEQDQLCGMHYLRIRVP